MSKDNATGQGTPSVPRPSSHDEGSASGERVIGLKIVTLSPPTSSDPNLLTAATQLQKEPPRDPFVGATVDNRYKIEATLGEGGMGVVYRGRHTIIDKKVALKVLRADLARDAEVTERFLNEAKAASAIGNPHIIDISDFGRLPDGSTYFVMEYLEGTPLSDLLRDQRAVPVPRILHIARQLAEGLLAAHSAGIVHRDLKPDNIFLIGRGAQKDFVKILDFGIAKVSTSEGKLTRAGTVFGTPHYMSPEQAAGAPVDHRGDIYSFGVILYELASGKVPFDADNFMGILTQHMYKAPVPIRALVPVPQDIPPGLEAIVLKCLSKRPEQRYETMEGLLADLGRLGDGLIPDAVPDMMGRSGGFNVPADYFKKGTGMPAPVPATPAELAIPRSRWPLYAGIAGVAAAVGIVVAIFASSSPSPASSPTQAASAATASAEPRPSAAPVGESNSRLTKQVVVAVDPADAEVFAGDRSLGTSPLAVELKEGESKELLVKRDGYASQTVTVDSTMGKRWVKLERARATGGRPGPLPAKPDAKPKPKTKKSIGGGEIVNPWGE
jgi:eukaryotic-like serine/threonine-protein kinase